MSDLPRYLRREFVSDEKPANDEVLQWDDTAKKWRPEAMSGAMKTSGAGYFTIPAMPAAGTACAKDAAANTWGSWVELIASTSAALYIYGVCVRNVTNTNNYVAVDIGTGAGGAESSIGYASLPGTDPGADSGLQGFTYLFPAHIPVATSTRIACRTAGSSTAADAIQVTLLCINQSNLVAL